ncbi:mannose-P-dolichol utilization defect 1 protein-like isoform X2 [Conger conger]|uniref:mannose-P-dolichol utilization defect 1 protein-like isoform X2 n=1 Tax=Conger conger TaxID=82655 RepID=UPI002A59D8A2|nr:mannose-P-dolichol utilization defect 1 protein-like isoform X2 [Conger conger]
MSRNSTKRMDTMNPFKDFLLTHYMPEKCYNEFFHNFNLIHVPCLNIFLSKILGVWIMLGTVVVKLPQICKLLRAGGAEGLSFVSSLFELFAITGSMVYCISLNFPIGAWGESLFIVIQNLTIGFLIQHFGGSTLKGVGFVLIYCCLLSLLISPLTPWSVVILMESSYMPAVIIAQLIQSGMNYRNGHTGQLSAVSVFLLFFGSLARIHISAKVRSCVIGTVVPLLKGRKNRHG